MCVCVCVCVQASEVRVNFVVMRHAEAVEEGGTSGEVLVRGARRAPEPQYFKRRSIFMKVNHQLIHLHSFLLAVGFI